MIVYLELQETYDVIDSIAGIDIGLTAQEYANEIEGAYIDNDTALTYPDLCFEIDDEAEPPYCKVNTIGQTAQILGGTHPPHRPR